MQASGIMLSAVLLGLFGANPAQAGFTSDLKKSTLTLTQVSDDGFVTIDDNGADGAFRVIEGGTATEFEAADSLVVEMLSNGDPSLMIDIDAGIARDLALRLESGDRNVLFTGDDNTIAGHVKIFGDEGDQAIELAVTTAFACGGKLLVDLGPGNDVVDEDGRDVTVGGDLVFKDVDGFENDGDMLVAGDGTFSIHEAAPAGTAEFDNDGTLVILGDFEFEIEDGGGSCQLNDGGVTIGGDVRIDCGTSANQLFVGLQNSRFGGDVDVECRSASGSFVTMTPTTVIGGSLEIEVGDGTNTIVLDGRCAGKSVEFEGGKGVDTVTVRLQARNAKGSIDLDKGDDVVTLSAPTSFKKLSIDFGKGSDTFNDNLGDAKAFKLSVDGLD